MTRSFFKPHIPNVVMAGECEHPSGNLSVNPPPPPIPDDTLIPFLPVICPLDVTRRRELASVLTRGARGVNPKIRGGEVAHTGIAPLKKFEATVRCCTQNGVRGGSATTHFHMAPKK